MAVYCITTAAPDFEIVDIYSHVANRRQQGEDALAAVLGSHPYQVARTSDQLEIKVSQGRVGRDLFPILIVLVATALGIEHVLANRFYRE